MAFVFETPTKISMSEGYFSVQTQLPLLNSRYRQLRTTDEVPSPESMGFHDSFANRPPKCASVILKFARNFTRQLWLKATILCVDETTGMDS
jgi:hypothetical protein